MPREHSLSLKSLQLDAVTSCSPHSNGMFSTAERSVYGTPLAHSVHVFPAGIHFSKLPMDRSS